MTVNNSFEAYKLQRELKRSGVVVSFVRYEDNEFGEPSGSPIALGEITCLYHEENSHISVTTGTVTQTRNKKVPRMLALASSVEKLGLKVGDKLFWKSQEYAVTGIVDVQNWGIINDISLEVVDDGLHARL